MKRLAAWHLLPPFRLGRNVNFVLAKTARWKRRKWSESDRLGGVTQTTRAV
ncbi:MAG: hypothetical protein IJV33_04150 [Bacteroidaceae bacterium]|nr:hypothetical protein [Bacteroidaceae bacterium]